MLSEVNFCLKNMILNSRRLLKLKVVTLQFRAIPFHLRSCVSTLPFQKREDGSHELVLLDPNPTMIVLVEQEEELKI